MADRVGVSVGFGQTGGDPALEKALTALRLAEAGGKGREFGVLSVPAPTYQKQLEIAAKSIRNAEERFREKFGRSPRERQGEFSDEFLRFFSERWAPPEAHPLNRRHYENLRRNYRQMGGPGERAALPDMKVTFNFEGQPPPALNQAALAQRVRETVERFMTDLYKGHEAPYYQEYNVGA